MKLMAPPSFVEDLLPQEVTTGIISAWVLPEVDEGNYELKEILVEPESSLQAFIAYEAESRQITFVDHMQSRDIAGNILKITIKLVNMNDEVFIYEQTVLVLAPPAFQDDLQPQAVTVGIFSSWTLPAIDEGDSALK